ncbi:uncharacterized mitochondrial protein AtMg00300-like [Helianthus annuus]|uniref:uncharacterized mitochondrial protein AtMg00300-like n=1 Tax=Helianthus annuus TaxID=4232 RepID=UPI000B8F408E|nr:uncharacterized mitochondrial protein AtMg00300-like [Helianthus annuus]
MSDKGYGTFFTKETCKIVGPKVVKKIEEIIAGSKTQVVSQRSGNVYVVDMLKDNPMSEACLFSAASTKETKLWHRRLSHTNHKTITTLSKQGLVRGLPPKLFTCDEHCVSCLKGKQHKSSFNSIDEFKTSQCLQLVHMDMFGPVKS